MPDAAVVVVTCEYQGSVPRGGGADRTDLWGVDGWEVEDVVGGRG